MSTGVGCIKLGNTCYSVTSDWKTMRRLLIDLKVKEGNIRTEEFTDY